MVERALDRVIFALGRWAAGGLVAGRAAVIAANVHDIALALAVAPVHVGGGKQKSRSALCRRSGFSGRCRSGSALYQNFGMATIVPPVRSLMTMPAHGCKSSKGELYLLAPFTYGTGSVKPAASSVRVHLVVLLPSPARAVDVDHVGHIDRKGLVGGSVVVRASRDLYGYSHVALIERGDVYLVAR